MENKVMTQEEKAKRYDEALERARLINNGEGVEAENGTSVCEAIFPELKESEDEKIRKKLIHIVSSHNTPKWYGLKVSKVLTWLKKQGEKKPVVIPEFRIGDIITPKGKKEYYTITDIVDGWYEFKEKHVNGGIPIHYQFGWEFVEQIPADKIEPKFKVGDRIYLKPKHRMPNDDTPIADTIHEIIAIDDRHYRFDGSFIFIEDQDKFELVEQKPIKTAMEAWKEMRLEVYAQASGNRHESNYSDDNSKIFSLNDIDEIFEKVSDFVAEQKPVEWSDDDNWNMQVFFNALDLYKEPVDKQMLKSWFKSLKSKIRTNSKPVEWSEEDEKIIEQICEDLQCGMENRNAHKIVRALHYDEIILSNISWLKSLRPQKQWKPSKEQLYWLTHVIPFSHNDIVPTEGIEVLSELCQQLKALKS